MTYERPPLAEAFQPYATYSIIMTCMVIYLGQALDPVGNFTTIMRGAVIPARLAAGFDFHTLLTYAFLHGSIIHLLGNLLFLWFFGPDIERVLGAYGLALLWLVCGVLAALSQIWADPNAMVSIIGASGAVSGVMGAYLVAFPHVRLRIALFWVIALPWEVPVMALLLGWLGFQLTMGLMSLGAMEGAVAYWAHLGGFAAGAAIMGLLLLTRIVDTDALKR
ncbi:MAG: rhomboid family intramembrane serine protease [Pseudomonadota bacterium]